MESFNVAYIFSCSLFVLFFAISNTSAIPLSRIIGDSLRNKDFSGSSTLLSSHRKNQGTLTQEIPRDIATRDKGFPRTPNAQPADIPHNRVMELFRSRRQTQESQQCVVSPNIPVVEASDLDTLLNATTFLGLDPSQPQHLTVPEGQPDQCPSQYHPWWPRVEDNLRAICPWRWDVKNVTAILNENGEFYPRQIYEAKCLCQRCVTANVFGCNELRQPVTVFQKIGCQNGLAVMLKRSIQVTVGCYCQSPRRNGQTTEATTDSGFDLLPED